MEDHPHGALSDLPFHPGMFLLRDLSEHHRTLFAEGRRLFNERSFWEAHEAWEEVWREVPDPRKRLLQGLIQAAAAYHLMLTRPRINGALRNIEKSLARLDGMPDICFDIEIAALREMMRQAHAEMRRVGQDGLAGIGDEYVPVL